MYLQNTNSHSMFGKNSEDCWGARGGRPYVKTNTVAYYMPPTYCLPYLNLMTILLVDIIPPFYKCGN